jgi:decaprenylphospho-beta-D-erythro-pentofuranosid-2-ulose 2-reductase
MSTVLLLGAGSDMAIALAHEFASAGHGLQLAARSIEKIRPLQSDLTIRYNISCTLHEFDAEQPGTHVAFFSSLPVHPDITISIFGYLGNQQMAESDWKECERTIVVNFTGAVSILNIVAGKYAQLKKGTIVGISSVAGERGRQSNYFYGSAKAGFTTYLSGLRNRLSPLGIPVLTVKPGFVYTRMTENMPLPGLLTATPEQVAAAILNAIEKKKNVIYVRWFWRYIMLVIKMIPENIFKKMKL